MTIKKIEWDDYLEVFFSKNEVVETWVRMRLLAFEYRTILYPNSNFDSIYKCTEENDVYFMELGRAHIALTCRYMYLMLYKGQYIIFGSADVDSLEPILKIKVIPTELTTDMDSIKHLIIEFLSFVSVSVKKNFVLIDFEWIFMELQLESMTLQEILSLDGKLTCISPDQMRQLT